VGPSDGMHSIRVLVLITTYFREAGGWEPKMVQHPIVKPLDVRLTTPSRFGLFLSNLSPAEVSVWPLNSRKGDGRAGGRRWWDRGQPGRLTGTLTSSLEALYVTWLRLAAFSGPLRIPQPDLH
jgi:hypothetical protein